VRAFADADDAAFVKALADKGFPRSRREHLHGSADPGRVAHLHLREVDGPHWRQALLLRDWLRSEAAERDAYAALKRGLAKSMTTTAEYTQAKGPWLEEAFARAEAWARHTGWSGT